MPNLCFEDIKDNHKLVLSTLFVSIADAVISYAIDKLVPFLDHCVDLIFLRRVGGGYIFVHRLLMEHIAEMSQP